MTEANTPPVTTKRKRTPKPLPDSIPAIAPVEVADLPVEAIAESIPVIEQAIASEITPIIQQELPKPKGKYNTGFYISIGIPVCSFCGEKESFTCPENKHDCPMLAAKDSANKAALQLIAPPVIAKDERTGDFGRS